VCHYHHHHHRIDIKKKEEEETQADRQKDSICLWFIRPVERQYWYQQFIFSLAVNTSQGWTFVAYENDKANEERTEEATRKERDMIISARSKYGSSINTR